MISQLRAGAFAVATTIALVTGCVLDDVVVESRVRPGVAIVCRGETRLTAAACRAWGDATLSDPIAPGGVTRLVLTANARDARCALRCGLLRRGHATGGRHRGGPMPMIAARSSC